jgi:hypothetical protein
MIQRLIRIVLAVTVAFVFTGQMEAAASHCARLVHGNAAAAAQEAPAEATPCHGEDHAAAPAEKPAPAHHKTPSQACECIAVLKAFSGDIASPGSTLIEPYEWARPEAVAFASITRNPEQRPPIA